VNGGGGKKKHNVQSENIERSNKDYLTCLIDILKTSKVKKYVKNIQGKDEPADTLQDAAKCAINWEMLMWSFLSTTGTAYRLLSPSQSPRSRPRIAQGNTSPCPGRCHADSTSHCTINSSPPKHTREGKG